MNMKIATRLSVFALAGALLAGCATQQNNAAVGTGTGAALGAGIGALAGGGKGAAIGAGVGALVGGVTGYNWQAIKNKLAPSAAQTGTQVTEQPDGSLKLNVPAGDVRDEPVRDHAGLHAAAERPGDDAEPEPASDGFDRRLHGQHGPAQLNQTLSQNRAQSVVNALAQRGVNGGRLSAQGMGASNPIADNATGRPRTEPPRRNLPARSAGAVSARRGESAGAGQGFRRSR